MLRSLFAYRYSYIEVFCGSYLNIEAAISLKFFFNSFGCSNIYYFTEFIVMSDFRFFYQLNETICNLESK